MAFTKCALILAIISFIFIQELAINGGNQPIMASDPECFGKCDHRCSESTEKDCKMHCVFCCGQCNCVPSGTSGNREECPCYDKWPYYIPGKFMCP
ncbi:unnamed protein product [Lupinus luteus]|uniref:Uncharacterized protein n=1 Tax=Lupinus luteus TaxID=3873 RepID=A0AAV1VUE9_LUPLU